MTFHVPYNNITLSPTSLFNTVGDFRHPPVVVRTVPYTALLYRYVISDLIEEQRADPRGAETDSGRQSRRLTPSFVSATLNSLHIIRHRPGTGDRQRAPVPALQRRLPFLCFFHWTMYEMSGWDSPDITQSYFILGATLFRAVKIFKSHRSLMLVLTMLVQLFCFSRK